LFPARRKAYDAPSTLVAGDGNMERQGDEVHVSQEEASGGVQPHIVRYVLGVSLLLIVILMSAIWIIGSVTR
jgi:hypothetical protein